MTEQQPRAYMLNNGLRRSARYDTIFYGAYAGIGATFDIRVRLDFKQKLDRKKLQKAADDALRAYPEFAVRPVLYNGRVCYEKNQNPVMLCDDDGRRLFFGTDDTNGFLFVFLCGETHLTFSLFHSLTDAHGMIHFIVTVLWNYVKMVFPPIRLAGPTLLKKHFIRLDDSLFHTMDDVERFDPLVKFAGTGDPLDPVDPARLYRLPPEVFDDTCESCHLINLEVSNQAFLRKTKELNTSFAPLLAALTAEAIHTQYDVGDRMISVITTADARRIFHTHSLSNLSYNCPLPLEPQDAALPLEERCAKLRAQMRSQLTPENAAAAFRLILSQCDEIDAMGPIDAVNKALTGPDGLDNTLTTNGTIFLTYPGRIGNNSISRVLLKGISPGMLAAERAIVVYAHRDTLMIQVTQKSDDPTLVNALRQVLEKYGFAPQIRDLGRVTQNIFDFDKIKRVSDNAEHD